MPEYRDKRKLLLHDDSPEIVQRLTQRVEIVETYHKGSPYIMSPIDRVEEFQARRRANSRDSYQHSRTRSPAYDDYGLKPAKTVSPTAAATVGTAVGNAVARRRHSMSPDKGTLNQSHYPWIGSNSSRANPAPLLLRVRCRLRLRIRHLQSQITPAQARQQRPPPPSLRRKMQRQPQRAKRGGPERLLFLGRS